MAEIMDGKSVGNGAFSLSVYPASQPVSLALTRNRSIEKLMNAGVTIRTAFCGPCFGAGDTPATPEFEANYGAPWGAVKSVLESEFTVWAALFGSLFVTHMQTSLTGEFSGRMSSRQLAISSQHRALAGPRSAEAVAWTIVAPPRRIMSNVPSSAISSSTVSEPSAWKASVWAGMSKPLGAVRSWLVVFTCKLSRALSW